MKDFLDLLGEILPAWRLPIIVAVLVLGVVGSGLKWVGFDNIKSGIALCLRRLGGKKMDGVIITGPTTKQECFERASVTGKKSKSGEVWVIIHPKGTGSYWVQPRTTDLDNKHWSVLAHVGNPGNADIGRQYEIMAIIAPDKPLTVGQVLDQWPPADHRSEVVEVVRA